MFIKNIKLTVKYGKKKIRYIHSYYVISGNVYNNTPNIST